MVVAWSNLVSAQGPLVLGLGLRVWGQGLTIPGLVPVDYVWFIITLIPNLSLGNMKLPSSGACGAVIGDGTG